MTDLLRSGRTWSRLRPPATDSEGRSTWCNPSDNDCSLHLHSVTLPHNFGRVFSSPAPGFVMGVGSIGEFLQPYEDCDTFLSTDAGLTWKMIRMEAHKYEFGDQGSILVVVNDEEGVDSVSYSTDLGKTWYVACSLLWCWSCMTHSHHRKRYNYGVQMRARVLMTIPDSTSQKFILVGQIARKDQVSGQGRVAVVFLDFKDTRPRQCGEADFEEWYARSSNHECLMGHKVRTLECDGAPHDILRFYLAMVQTPKTGCQLLRW